MCNSILIKFTPCLTLFLIFSMHLLQLCLILTILFVGLSLTTFLPSPPHIAIIMDGNSRYHKSNTNTKLSPHSHLQHYKGASTTISLITHITQSKRFDSLTHLTLFALSDENLTKRTPLELGGIRSVLQLKLSEILSQNNNSNKKSLLDEWSDCGVRVKFVGAREGSMGDFLGPDIIEQLDRVESRVASHPISRQPLTVNICLGYSGRSEILRAGERANERAEMATTTHTHY